MYINNPGRPSPPTWPPGGWAGCHGPSARDKAMLSNPAPRTIPRLPRPKNYIPTFGKPYQPSRWRRFLSWFHRITFWVFARPELPKLSTRETDGDIETFFTACELGLSYSVAQQYAEKAEDAEWEERIAYRERLPEIMKAEAEKREKETAEARKKEAEYRRRQRLNEEMSRVATLGTRPDTGRLRASIQHLAETEPFLERYVINPQNPRELGKAITEELKGLDDSLGRINW